MLSKVCVIAFAAALVLVCVTAPWLFPWLTRYSEYLQGKETLLLGSTYAAAIPAAAALYSLHGLLHNITQEKIFVETNVLNLRKISWCCILAAVIFAVSSIYYILFLLLSVAMAFIGLILRVLKNVFAEAVRLKMENDYTI